MKQSISPAEKTVGIMLANGLTKKEIANQLDKSVRTVERQTDMLYKKTGARNLADITRVMISRYTGIPVEDLLINLAHDITVAVAVGFVTWVVMQPETVELLKASLISLLK